MIFVRCILYISYRAIYFLPTEELFSFPLPKIKWQDKNKLYGFTFARTRRKRARANAFQCDLRKQWVGRFANACILNTPRL